MQILGIKTDKVTPESHKDIFSVLDKFLPEKISESSILAVTSKIVSITEGGVVPFDPAKKDELIKKESQYYLPRHKNLYNVSLTITRNNLVATAGIDESNAGNLFILWPKDPQTSANKIRSYLKKRYNLKNIGVIITDSKTTPLRMGVTAIAISHSGFLPLKNYRGKKDLFGRLFKFEKLNLIDCLSSTACLIMGEGSEQTPLALIEDIPNIKFQARDPSQKDLNSLKITPKIDLYSPLLESVSWEKGDKE